MGKPPTLFGFRNKMFNLISTGGYALEISSQHGHGFFSHEDNMLPKQSVVGLCLASVFVLLICVSHRASGQATSATSAAPTKVMAPHLPIAPTITKPKNLAAGTPALRSLVGGPWMTDANFKSSIYLKNAVATDPITVTPIIYLSNGTKYALPAVALEPSGTAIIDINAGLEQQGIASYATLSGYVELQYAWPWDPICAFIRDVDVTHSLIFTYGLQPLAPTPQSQSSSAVQTVEGIWWMRESNVTGFVALTNTSSQQVTANVRVTDDQNAPLGNHPVTVSPNGTKIVNLSELQSVPGSAGGIHITYNAPQDSLLINGGLEDLGNGYSATLRFAPAPSASATPTKTSFGELGLMVGAADPMMAFPAGTTFTPYSILRNVSDSPISVTPTLWWMEGGKARSSQRPQINLLSNQTQTLDVMSMISAAGLISAIRAFNGSVNLILDTQGKQGGLILAAGSVDKSNTYVFEVAPRPIMESASKSISYWSTGNGDDTMVTLWNPADEAQDLVFQVIFSGGHYGLPIHLGPRETRTLNVSQVIESQVPDPEGNIVPAAIHTGSLNIAGSQADNQSILVALDAGIYNVRKATCGPGCYQCNGWVSSSITPNPFFVEVENTAYLTFTDTWNNNSTYDLTNVAQWGGGGNVTASSGGVVTGVNAGTASVGAGDPYEPVFAGIVCGMYSNPCPVGYGVSGSTSGNVGDPTPVVQSVSPSVWNAGATTTVTITGTGFGTAPQLTLSDASIGVQVTSSGDTQIVANITVPASAPNENVTVTVTSTGYNGSGFQSGGGSQPSHGSNTASVKAKTVPCPSSVTIDQITTRSLPDHDQPSWLTGIGILARMKVGPAGTDYTGASLLETVTPTSNSCPSNIQTYTSFPTITTANSGPFIVGSSAVWEGSNFLSMLNDFYDSQRNVVSINVLGLTNVQSCVAKATQTYSCNGSTIGTFALTNTYTAGTLNGQAVTNVNTTKQ